MVRYGLAKVLRGVNLFKHKNLLMVLKTYSCKDLAATLKTFKVKFLVLFLLHNQLDVRKNKLIISLNL